MTSWSGTDIAVGAQAQARTTGVPNVWVLLADQCVPSCVSGLEALGWVQVATSSCQEALNDPDALHGYQAAVISMPTSTRESRSIVERLVRDMQERHVLGVILTEDTEVIPKVNPEAGRLVPKIQTCRPDVGAEELYGRLCTLLEYRPAFDEIERYLDQLEDWASALNNRFEEVNKELRLAWRVQQDFLPKSLPNSERARFATLFRPASWVSGDIYDIFRLDERHIGFYVADVVGHGVAAGLMTLFVKRSLVTKEITSNSYRLVPPGQALSRLNVDLSVMDLPEQQFVTACYGILNTQTRELTLARGGHPLPILIEPAGAVSRIDVAGPLLGVFQESQFVDRHVQLRPGSKIVFISDGLEQAFGRDEAAEQAVIDHLSERAALSADEMIEAFQATLDAQESSLHAPDDITMVVVEVPGD